jgi:hypothetical protein
MPFVLRVCLCQGALGYARLYNVPLTKEQLTRSAARSAVPVTVSSAPELLSNYRFEAGMYV